MSQTSIRKETIYTPKETHEIGRLENTIRDRSNSLLERQIAQAQLDELKRSKEATPHNHKHNLRSLEEDSVHGSSNIYHDDEAFEKFGMGAESQHHPGSKVANQAIADKQSVKNNHKARGTQKEKVEESEREPIVLPEH